MSTASTQSTWRVVRDAAYHAVALYFAPLATIMSSLPLKQRARRRSAHFLLVSADALEPRLILTEQHFQPDEERGRDEFREQLRTLVIKTISLVFPESHVEYQYDAHGRLDVIWDADNHRVLTHKRLGTLKKELTRTVAQLHYSVADARLLEHSSTFYIKLVARDASASDHQRQEILMGEYTGATFYLKNDNGAKRLGRHSCDTCTYAREWSSSRGHLCAIGKVMGPPAQKEATQNGLPVYYDCKYWVEGYPQG